MQTTTQANTTQSDPARPRGTTDRWEGASTIPREHVRELHTLDHSPLRSFALHITALALCGVAATVACNTGYPLVTLAFWCVTGFLAHAIPLASHDASHGTLHPSRRINELLGIGIGTSILVPRSVYRYAHAQHHTHIATEKDPELWPFTIPTVPLWVRRSAAFCEVFLGFVYTPLLFLRSILAAEDVPADQMKLIKREYALIVVFWTGVFSAVAWAGVWTEFVMGFGGPWLVAGAFQSLNKYVEHMGMQGVGVVGSTRSVVPEADFGKSLAEAWQNVAYHGTHHLYAKIPYYKLPEASQHVIADQAPEGTLYKTYAAAFFAMLPTLKDPRIGVRWRENLNAEADTLIAS